MGTSTGRRSSSGGHNIYGDSRILFISTQPGSESGGGNMSGRRAKSIAIELPAYPANNCRATQQHLYSLLQSCNAIGTLLQVHTQVVVNGLSQKSYIIAKLLSFYLTSGQLQHAQKLFEKVENPSTTLWNLMIRGHSRSEIPRKSVQFFNRMLAAGAEPNEFTYSSLLSASARTGLMRQGEQVHARVLVSGHGSNVFVETNLINLYARCEGGDGVAKARRVFDYMTQRSTVSWNSILAGYIRVGDFDGARRIFDEMLQRNVVSWTTMIAGCARIGKSKQALSLFREMRRTNIELDLAALVAALSACAESCDLNLGKWIHWYIQERFSAKNQQPSVLLYNALIHMYASCGIVEVAYKVFKDMPQKSTVSWTIIIMAFAKQGHGGEALNLYRTMVNVGAKEVRPDEITFLGVLCACSHAGLVDEGCQIFSSMNETWGISPRIEHYGCMVDLLSRAGFLNEALALIEAMPIKPNDAVWGALLGGCRIHINAELASQVAKELIVELNTDLAPGYLVLLLNVYAFAKRWQDVITVKQKMLEIGVKKPPGQSWIQLNGVVHDFVAGDMTHIHSSFIYETLGEIVRQTQKDFITGDPLDIEGQEMRETVIVFAPLIMVSQLQLLISLQNRRFKYSFHYWITAALWQFYCSSCFNRH